MLVDREMHLNMPYPRHLDTVCHLMLSECYAETWEMYALGRMVGPKIAAMPWSTRIARSIRADQGCDITNTERAVDMLQTINPEPWFRFIPGQPPITVEPQSATDHSPTVAD